MARKITNLTTENGQPHKMGVGDSLVFIQFDDILGLEFESAEHGRLHFTFENDGVTTRRTSLSFSGNDYGGVHLLAVLLLNIDPKTDYEWRYEGDKRYCTIKS